jgi:hypothetical protein
MSINKLIGIHAVQGWWRSRGATMGNLRRPGKRLWKRDTSYLLLISLALPEAEQPSSENTKLRNAR